MKASTTSTNLYKWKRALIGGLISGSIAALCIINYLGAFYFGFMLPVMFLDLSPNNPLGELILATLFWFVVGLSITYFSRKIRTAMGCWFLLYMACYFVGIFMILLALGDY